MFSALNQVKSLNFLTENQGGAGQEEACGSSDPLLGRVAFPPFSNLVLHTLASPPQAAAALAISPPLLILVLSPSGRRTEGVKRPTPAREGAHPISPAAGRLTGTGMQGLGSHDQRGAHGVEGKFLKVVAGLLGEDLVDHESLVAPPGCFELAGRGEPQLRVAVHGEPGPRGLAHRRRGLCPAPRQPGGGGALAGRGGERAPGAPAARLDPPADQHLRRAFLGHRDCQSARASCRAGCGVTPRGRRRPARLCQLGGSLRAACPSLSSPPPACPRLSLFCPSLSILRHSLCLSSPPLCWNNLQVCVCVVCALEGARGAGSAHCPARRPGRRRAAAPSASQRTSFARAFFARISLPTWPRSPCLQTRDGRV